MPLLITDGNGDIVYKGRAFSKNAAAFLADAGESSVWENGHVAFCKEITVDGRVYRLYIDRAGMQTMFGVRGSVQADRLFSVEDIVGEAKCALTLALLPQMLAHTYGKALHECGVHLDVRALKAQKTVLVPPNALLLALALMIRLCALGGKSVRLSAVPTAQGATVFADAPIEGKRHASSPLPTVLTALLYEVSAAAGFVAEYREKEQTATWSLTLCPIDIGLLGFKTASPAELETYAFRCRILAALLLSEPLPEQDTAGV